MKTDIGIDIIGAIFSIIAILPIVMLIVNKKKREKKVLQSLSKIAAQNNCQIDQSETLGNFAIGIDKSKNFAFFYKQDQEITQSVNLNEIQNCKVIKTIRTFKNKDGNQKEIEKLELSFIPIGKNNPEITFEFFNINVNSQLYGELQSIEKWSRLINERVNHKK